jgi:pimeloyl-ACP methyl ester carboxylesterase
VLFDQQATFANGQPLFPRVEYPDNPPALQFVEDFVVALMQTMSRQPPHLDLTKVIPIGGSLGGNLALRLGRRTDLEWLSAVCGWSPASVWPSFAAQGWTGRMVIGHCTDRMNALEDRLQDVQESPAGTRHQHFSEVFDLDAFPQGVRYTGSILDIVPPQAEQWYRAGDWQQCKTVSICHDRLDRREGYDPTFRRWHWRISEDQLTYSHRDPDPVLGVPRYQLNAIPMLLGAGENDAYNVPGFPSPNICPNTQDLAQEMTNTPGVSLFLNDTGHSIHNERPKELSRVIFDFLSRGFQRAEWVGYWKELYTDADNLAMLDVASNADGRLEVFGVNVLGQIYHTWQTQPGGGWVGNWSQLYSNADNLAMLDVGRNADGRLEVFGVNWLGQIYHTWQTQPGGGWVGNWSQLYSNADNLRSLRVAANADGRLEVFGINVMDRIYHTWQTQPNNGWVGSWTELYRDAENLAMLDVGRNADGRLEVFGVNVLDRIWHTWQTQRKGAQVPQKQVPLPWLSLLLGSSG